MSINDRRRFTMHGWSSHWSHKYGGLLGVERQRFIKKNLELKIVSHNMMQSIFSNFSLNKCKNWFKGIGQVYMASLFWPFMCLTLFFNFVFLFAYCKKNRCCFYSRYIIKNIIKFNFCKSSKRKSMNV